MKKGLWIYLIILIFLATGIDYLALKTRYITPETTQNFSVGSERYIFVRGNTDTVEVTTASDGYYRIKSGDVIAEGKHITGKYFQDTTKLPVGKWIIESSGTLVSFTVVSQSLVVITTKPFMGTIIGIIMTTLVFGAVLFLFGMLFAYD